MNGIRDIALAFSASAVLTAALGLLGGNRLQRSGRYIIALTLICSVLSAAVGGNFSFSLPSGQDNTSSYSENELCEYQAEYIIGDILSSKDIYFEKIIAKATKSDDNSIIINEIEVFGAKNADEVSAALKEQGIDCDIRVVE